MTDILRDPIWNFLAFVIALLALLISIIIFQINKKKKSLAFLVISDTQLQSLNDIESGNLQVIYKDSPVKNVHLLVLKIINNGNLPIATRDFDEPLCFSFGEQSKILNGGIIDQDPKTLLTTFSVISNKIRIEPLLFNPKDHITFKLLVSGYENVEPTTRIVGIREVNQLSNNSLEYVIINTYLIVILLFLIFVFAMFIVAFTPLGGKVYSLETSKMLVIIILSITGFLLLLTGINAFLRNIRNN